jgi:NADP-dependent aldehyde dehydrogenase
LSTVTKELRTHEPLVDETASIWADLPRTVRADALNRVAGAIDAVEDELVAVAQRETHLTTGRLHGEVRRTTGQLRAFAELLREGEYLDVVVSPAAADATGIRRMEFPVGRVAVFAASNFPFAFSVLGGDTASALAAGCPVTVKIHEGHPETSRRVAAIANEALAAVGAPEGLLETIEGLESGRDLVRDPSTRAVGFTGSIAGARALIDVIRTRPEPIPFFGELGSVNPVIVTPGAAIARTQAIADGFIESLTLGAGQYCTNPGLIFVPRTSALAARIADTVSSAPAGPMLTNRIAETYRHDVEARDADGRMHSITRGTTNGTAATARVWTIDLATFASDIATFTEEIFGPASLLVEYDDVRELAAVVTQLPGSLTGAVHAEPDETEITRTLTAGLRRRAGRLIFNDWPTGVAVCWAMQHGGPWPSSTAPAHTSVGARAIARWLAPVAFQGWPENLLPPDLRDDAAVPRRVEPS